MPFMQADTRFLSFMLDKFQEYVWSAHEFTEGKWDQHAEDPTEDQKDLSAFNSHTAHQMQANWNVHRTQCTPYHDERLQPTIAERNGKRDVETSLPPSWETKVQQEQETKSSAGKCVSFDFLIRTKRRVWCACCFAIRCFRCVRGIAEVRKVEKQLQIADFLDMGCRK